MAYAFDECESLTDVFIGDGFTAVGECAFRNCTKLAHIWFPEDLETIKEMAFFNCQSLVSVELSDTVKAIENHAFSGCKSLSRVRITVRQPLVKKIKIADDAFDRCKVPAEKMVKRMPARQ